MGIQDSKDRTAPSACKLFGNRAGVVPTIGKVVWVGSPRSFDRSVNLEESASDPEQCLQKNPLFDDFQELIRTAGLDFSRDFDLVFQSSQKEKIYLFSANNLLTKAVVLHDLCYAERGDLVKPKRGNDLYKHVVSPKVHPKKDWLGRLERAGAAVVVNVYSNYTAYPHHHNNYVMPTALLLEGQEGTFQPIAQGRIGRLQADVLVNRFLIAP